MQQSVLQRVTAGTSFSFGVATTANKMKRSDARAKSLSCLYF